MIVFYIQHKENEMITTLTSSSNCDLDCTKTCAQVKSKCCHKYKKKGINCKRCPLRVN